MTDLQDLNDITLLYSFATDHHLPQRLDLRGLVLFEFLNEVLDPSRVLSTDDGINQEKRIPVSDSRRYNNLSVFICSVLGLKHLLLASYPG